MVSSVTASSSVSENWVWGREAPQKIAGLVPIAERAALRPVPTYAALLISRLTCFLCSSARPLLCRAQVCLHLTHTIQENKPKTTRKPFTMSVCHISSFLALSKSVSSNYLAPRVTYDRVESLRHLWHENDHPQMPSTLSYSPTAGPTPNTWCFCQACPK